MAIVHGVFAGIRGKVGNVIYQVNKGEQILKQMAYPENPQSSGQTTYRTVFKFVIEAFKSLSKNWINIFWSPFLSGNQQAWGKFIGVNLDHMAGSFAGDDAILSQGSLEGVADLTCTYDTADGAVAVNFDGTIHLNGEASDCINACIYDADQKKVVGYEFGTDTRFDEGFNFYVPSGLTATNLTCYLTMSNTEALSIPPTAVSDSQKCTCSAPV